MIDQERIRSDFPILRTNIIYLDSAATSLTPEPVVEKMLEFYHEYRANVVRGVHKLSQRASEEYNAARSKVASFLNAESDEEVVMTRNTTEGINIVANGLGWRRGDKIVTTLIEHHSNYIPWLRMRERCGVDVEVVRPNREGLFDPDDFEGVIDDKTRLVAMVHVSNVLGVITPVEEVAKIAHEHGALVLIDGAQSVPHMRVDVQKIGCDFLAFSGHKMCAPTGSGALYIRRELLDEVEPTYIGGGTIEDVGLDHYKLAASPRRYEAGTPAIAEAIGLGAATDYLRRIGMENVEAHDRGLIKMMYNRLMEILKVEVYGPDPRHKVGVMSFNVGDLNPHDVALSLDVSSNIMVRSGFHCAIPLMRELLHRPKGTVRASTYIYNTEEEVEKFLSAVAEISAPLT